MADEESIFLKENYFVFIDVLSKYFVIKHREPFDYETGRETTTIFSSVSSGSHSGDKSVDVLEPDVSPRHLFQVLWGVKDVDMRYYLKLPTGTSRMGTDDEKSVGYVNAVRSPYYDPNPQFMFWLISDYYPAFDVYNDSPIDLTPYIRFTGMKYDITEVKDPTVIDALKKKKLPCRDITIAGVETTSTLR